MCAKEKDFSWHDGVTKRNYFLFVIICTYYYLPTALIKVSIFYTEYGTGRWVQLWLGTSPTLSTGWSPGAKQVSIYLCQEFKTIHREITMVKFVHRNLGCSIIYSFLFIDSMTLHIFRSYDLFVNGGTIYEKGVDVDPSIGRRGMFFNIFTICKVLGLWVEFTTF